MKTLSTLAIVSIAFGSVACAANTTTTDPTPTSGDKTATTEGTLVVQPNDKGVKGSYTLAGDVLTFEASAQANEVYEVDFMLHGLTLDATVDKVHHTSSLDGFATANGGDTQVVEADRKLVLSFSKAFNDQVGKNPTGIDAVVQSMASMWSETTPTVKLNRRVMGEEGRGWTSLCGYMHQYVGATHDCWSYDDGDANSSQWAYVGIESSSTYYWRNGWSTASFDHAAWPYEYGDCFGRCGADCGSYVYTLDCHNHDGCVRNGHDLASLWCDDEFTSASDDYLFAPSCGWD